MKITIKLLAVSILFTLMLLNTYSCNGPTKTKTETTTKPPPPLPPPVAKADLMILNAKLEKSGTADKRYTHVLIVTIRNNGDTIAKGFNSGCTYDCSGGLTLSGGANVVQGGYIGANSDYVYKIPFHIYCAGPPAFLNLKFDVDSENKVIESNENNNKRTIRVAVPF